MEDHERRTALRQFELILMAIEKTSPDALVVGVIGTDSENKDFMVPIMPQLTCECSQILLSIADNIKKNGLPKPEVVVPENP